MSGRPAWLSKRPLLFLAILIPLAGFYLFWSATGEIGFLGGDGPNYLMLADHLRVFGRKDPVYDAIGSVSRFPPVYSALLGLFGVSTHLAAAHLLTVACLFVAWFALQGWLRGEGYGSSQVLLQLVVLVLLPETLREALAIQSEFLYLALSLLVLGLLGSQPAAHRPTRLYAAAALVATAILTREVGLSLLVPLAVASLRVSRIATVKALAIAILPVAAWHQFHHASVDYGRILGAVYGSDWKTALLQQLAEELPALRSGFAGNFTLFEGFGPLTDLLGGLCLLATACRALRRNLAALYVLANLAILMVWPYPEEARRFVWVLIPLLLAQPPLLLAEWRREPPTGRIPRSLCFFMALAVLTMAVPSAAFMVKARREAATAGVPGAAGYHVWYVPDRSDAAYGVGFESTIVQALADVQAIVPPADCIMAARPDIVSYFTHRRSYFLPLESVPDAAFMPMLHEQGCHYVFAYGVGDARYETSMYPSARIADTGEIMLERRRLNAPHHARPVCRLYRLN